MARVILLSATPAADDNDDHLRPLRDLKAKAAQDRFGLHEIVPDPAVADLILFVESYGAGWHFERVRRHPFVRRYREKCFLFNNNPYVIPFLPGIYTGIDTRWASSRTISGFYVGMPANEFADFDPPRSDLPYLFSFVGSFENAPVRRAIAQLRHPRGLIHDTAADYARVLSRSMSAGERREYHRRYAEITRGSKFVLCPRGLSVSSVRVFETMQMGRVPVILSDGWVRPPGPAWERFAIQIPEAECAQIPRILEQREADALAMGSLAREQWLEWFADDVVFHRAVEQCLALKINRRVPERLARWPVYLQYLRPFHLRRAVGATIRSLRRRSPGAAASAVVRPGSQPNRTER